MRLVMIALLLCWSATAAATEMWRWVDENGVVHFSDRPREGAERVDVRRVQSYTAPEVVPTAVEARDEAAAQAEPAGAGYRGFRIVSPVGGETLWNIAGELSIELAVDPGLRSNHRFQVYLDGSRVADAPDRATQFTITEVYRGEHSLRVAIVDERGREIASTEPVVFFVQQTSVQNPARPRPTPRPGGGG